MHLKGGGGGGVAVLVYEKMTILNFFCEFIPVENPYIQPWYSQCIFAYAKES